MRSEEHTSELQSHSFISSAVFFFNDTATTEIYTLSLHDALPISVQGDGFFKILMPDGSFAYTRDGSFNLDAQGRIVTANGNVVQPGVTVPPTPSSITINKQGQVSV